METLIALDFLLCFFPEEKFRKQHSCNRISNWALVQPVLLWLEKKVQKRRSRRSPSYPQKIKICLLSPVPHSSPITQGGAAVCSHILSGGW